MEERGAAFVIAPGIAVTNAHNVDGVAPAQVIGTSQSYDLLFFRTERTGTMTASEPGTGEHVIAYGQGVSGEVREARGRGA